MPVTTELVHSVTFGLPGDDANYLGGGWSAPENGFRWMVGKESELWLNNPGAADAFVLQLDLSPYCNSTTVPSQRLSVSVRGRVIGRSVLSQSSSVAYQIPADLLSSEAPVRVLFSHPDASRPLDAGHPRDDRQLAFSVRRLRLLRTKGDLAKLQVEGGAGISVEEVQRQTGMPAENFMLQFESLGDNCEFGLVQRRCGAEPLSLLRFSNFRLPDLIRGLEREFHGLGEPENLEFWLDKSRRQEYVMRDRVHSLIFHTFLNAGDVDESKLVQQQGARLKFLRRKFLEDLANGEKIFVVKRNEPYAEQEILALFASLNRLGRSTLLWVTLAGRENEPGCVERIMPGLLKGYIDRFAPYENAHDLSLDLWLKICVAAQQIRSGVSARIDA